MAYHGKLLRVFLAGGVALGTLISASAASAAAPAEGANGDDDIIVTASKREERLIDVGGAVTAVSGATLEYRNLRSVEDFAAQVPGFNFQKAGNRAIRLVLRGLNSGGAGATTGVIIDETPLSYQSGLSNGAIDTANLDTFDMARIEVLKGPQGTLYGATAQGGLLKYVTNAPDLSQASFSGELGSEIIDKGGAGYVARGVVNIPLIDGKLAIRAGGFYEDVAGYVDNPLLGRQDANGGYRWSGRISILFKPSEAFSLRVTGFRQDQSFADDGRVEIVGANASPNAQPANRYDIANGGRLLHNTLLSAPSDNRYEYLNATATLDVGFADLLSSTSWGKLSTIFSADISSLNAGPGLTYAALLGAAYYSQAVKINQVQTNQADRVNQEFRLSSRPDSKIAGMGFDWQIGGFYAREKVTFLQGYDVISVATNAILTAPIAGGSLNAPARYEEYSGFANGTLHFTDTVDLSLGGRYTSNKQNSRIFYLAGFATGPTYNSPPVESKENKFTYSAALRWKFNPNSLLYGRIASGYRAGGPNFLFAGAPVDYPTTYKADNTVNYEIGLRTELFNKLLSIDVAAFYIDWSDIQIVSRFTSNTGQSFSVVGNAGTAKSQGLEWSFALKPAAGLRLSTVGSYTEAELKQSAPALGALAGQQLAFVPKFSNTVNVDYETRLGSQADGYAGISWSYTGARFTDFGVGTYPGHQRLPDYSLFNGQVGFRVKNLDFSFYVQNITNKIVVTNYNAGGGFNLTGLADIVQPRTFGVKLGVRY